MGTHVVLLRHGRTAWNQELRWQGQTDIPLDEVGLQQAAAAAEVLAELEIAKIVSSPLQRARVTAQLLSDRRGVPVEVDPRLRETDGGLWEGMTQAEIRAQYNDELIAWFGDAAAPAGINGETRHQIAARFHAAVEHHVVPNETIVIATHGGVARAGILSLLNLPLDNVGVFKVLYNCGWAVLDHDDVTGGWRVSDYNLSASRPLPEQHI